jgi:hypothetical protein
MQQESICHKQLEVGLVSRYEPMKRCVELLILGKVITLVLILIGDGKENELESQ